MRTAEKKNSRKGKNRAAQADPRLSQAIGFESLETRQLMATINVADFGATANNGSDDRAAILNAMNASRAGDTILFSGGVFNMSNEITLLGDRTYLGQNGATLKGQGTEGHLLKIQSDNVTVRGLTLDGGGMFLERTGGKNNNITIDNNRILQSATGSHRSGITFTSGLANSRVTNNLFTGYNGGYAMYGYNYNNLTIANNEVFNTTAGFHIDAFNDCANLLVEQNYIHGTMNMGMEFQSTANGLVFQDNWYESPSFTTLPGTSGPNSMAYSLILDKSSNITIRRNVAIMPLKTSTDYIRITFEVGGDNCLVEDNYSFGGNHVVAMNDGVGTSSVTVRNNKFLSYAQGISNSFGSPERTLTQSNNGNIRLSDAMEARLAAHDVPGINQRYGTSSSTAPTNPAPQPTPAPAPTPAPTPTAPAGPTGLLALATGATTVNLFWSDKGSGESGYKIERQSNGGAWTQIASVGANSAGYQVTGLTAGTKYSFRVCAFNSVGNSAWSNTSTATPAVADAGTKYVSDMAVDSATNGWGQFERDMSNGEQAAKDGRAITVGTETYAKGLGVHAGSEISVALDGAYSSFLADIGVDAEVGANGSVVFEVWADGEMVYSSGTMTSANGTKAVNVDLTGKQQLVLKVSDAGNGNTFDHADWANARLTLASVTPPVVDPVPNPEPDPAPVPQPDLADPNTPAVVYLSDLTYTSATNGWGPVELDESVGEIPAGDGRALTLNGKTYDKGLGVHANSDVRYALNGEYGTFSTDIGLDDETGKKGTAVFQVWADGVLLYESGKMTGASLTKSINVNIQGRQELRLVVTNASDNFHNDHADWADARLTPLPPTVNHLSDMEPVSATNGWGPVEFDTSVGESPAGDGRRIMLGGKAYDKGLGVHSDSKLVYDLKGLYSTFTTDLGIDDEVGNNGSVMFQIFADGALLYDSGVMTGASATKTATVNVSGKSQLWLVVSNAGDGATFDHADWGNARLAA